MNVADFLKTKAGQNPENRKRLEEAARALGSTTYSDCKVTALAGLDNPKREHPSVQALAGSTPAKARRKTSVVICVEIVRYGVRALDEDNLIAGAKPLRDAIARSLGVDDADKRIRWRYSQVLTECSTGTLVRIERLK